MATFLTTEEMAAHLAKSLERVAEFLAEEALRIRAVGAGEPTQATQAPSFEELPFSDDFPEEAAQVASVPHGSTAVCPSHRIEYLPGRKGSYCPAESDEPNWSYVSRKNGKSYCGITPKSAAAWLRQHA